MPLPSSLVGESGAPFEHALDARWTMAYAAGLGHDEPAYLDTQARADVLAHPLFPVCYEWPAFLDPALLPSAGALGPEERVRGVHATHDLVLHRPVRAGSRVTTCARIVQVEARKPGAYLLARFDTHDDEGRALSTTWYGTIFRGVAVTGGDRSEEGALPPKLAATRLGDAREHALPVAANAAHVYTECARIWNPIHTDRAVALGAGLPDIILHGTATLALAVSTVVREYLGGDAERVARIAGRFAGMVAMPSTCTVRVAGDEAGGAFHFEVANEAGETAVRDGRLELRR